MEIAIKPILWTYREILETDKNYVIGEHEVRIRLTQNRESKYISTGYSSSVDNWDSANRIPKMSHPHYVALITRIKKFLDDINYEIKSAEKAGRLITHDEIKARLSSQLNQPVVVGKPSKILAYIKHLIDYYDSVDNLVVSAICYTLFRGKTDHLFAGKELQLML